MSAKRIVITGVSQGLGRALVEEFIALGHHVAGCARNAAAIDTLMSQHGAPNHFSALDVSDDKAVIAWSQTVLTDFGTPDLLINNAAIVNANAPLWQVSAEEVSPVDRHQYQRRSQRPARLSARNAGGQQRHHRQSQQRLGSFCLR